jgi:hypothetical protein
MNLIEVFLQQGHFAFPEHSVFWKILINILFKAASPLPRSYSDKPSFFSTTKSLLSSLTKFLPMTTISIPPEARQEE